MQGMSQIVGALNFRKIGTIGIGDHWLQLISYCFNTFGCTVKSAMCGLKYKEKILKRPPFAENICDVAH